MTRLAELRALLTKAHAPLVVLSGTAIVSASAADDTIVAHAVDDEKALALVAAVNALPALLEVAEKVAALMKVLPVMPTARIKWHADEVDAALVKLT